MYYKKNEKYGTGNTCITSCVERLMYVLLGANLKGVDMEGSQMTGINLRVATLKNAKLKNCNLRGATLAGTDLEVSRRYLSGLNLRLNDQVNLKQMESDSSYNNC